MLAAVWLTPDPLESPNRATPKRENRSISCPSAVAAVKQLRLHADFEPMRRQPKIGLAGLALSLAWMLLSGPSVLAATPSASHSAGRHRVVRRHRRSTTSRHGIRKAQNSPAPDPSGGPIPTTSPRG